MAEGWFRYLQIVPIAPIGQCGRAADLKFLAALAANSIRDLNRGAAPQTANLLVPFAFGSSRKKVL
jgi:hypothetical protein